MASTDPATLSPDHTDPKIPAGSDAAMIATPQEAPISLSQELKEQIQIHIINQYASDKSALTPTEFISFLQHEQKDSMGTWDEVVTAEKLEEFLLSPTNDSVKVPETDLSHPLKDYLISTSHNTYLTSNQLYGHASIEGYKATLLKGCRCIEIDCWDGHDNEPRVVHGHTAVEPISFRVVCEAIAKFAFVTTDLPIIVSLEVHCNLEQQQKMVDIMHEQFGDSLLKSKVEGVDLEALPSPLLLKRKILLKSKYLPPERRSALDQEPSSSSEEEDNNSDGDGDDDDDNDNDGPEVEDNAKDTENSTTEDPKASTSSTVKSGFRAELKSYLKNDLKKDVKAQMQDLKSQFHNLHLHRSNQPPRPPKPPKPPKVPNVKTLRSLSDLGVYTTSTHYHSFSHPLSRLFNHVHSFSERVFKKLLDEDPQSLKQHNKMYLTRVYPFGLRFSSSNEEPAVFWRHGAQLVALNWQKFDLGMQENEALFKHSGGMVLKPEYIDSGQPKAMYLTFEVIGASGLPCPEGVKDIGKLTPYVRIEVRTGETLKRATKKKKNAGSSVIWNETLAFNRVVDNLGFLVYHDKMDRDELFAIYTARLDALQSGYRFLRLLDVEGRQIPGAVLMIRVIKKDV